MSTNLSEKLKSLGVKVGVRELPPPTSRNAHSIEQVVPGCLIDTPDGTTLVVESHYDLDYRHGHAKLAFSRPLQIIAEWAREPSLAQCPRDEFVFLDIETTGLMGGTGTYAFLVGVGRLGNDGFRLTQVFMRDPSEEPAALAALARLVQPAGALVTFNGKSFDIPVLNARYVMNGDLTPFASVPHLDLLHLARRLWRDRLNDRALTSLESHILGAVRTEEDIPGWLVPQIYFDYLRDGDARPLKRVFYHNAMDVVAMAALLNHIALMLDEPLTFAVEHGLDLLAVAKLYEDLERSDDAVKLYRRGLECDLSEEAFRKAVQRLALMHRRRGEKLDAVELWRAAARTGQLYAYVELAKYYEHQARDCAQAANWTREALYNLDKRKAPPDLYRKWQGALAHRLERLEKKLNKQTSPRKRRNGDGPE